MVRTTKAQRKSLKRIYDRYDPVHNRLTYKQFRKGLQGTFYMDGAVVIGVLGMFLCIEADGYTHS